MELERLKQQRDILENGMTHRSVAHKAQYLDDIHRSLQIAKTICEYVDEKQLLRIAQFSQWKQTFGLYLEKLKVCLEENECTYDLHLVMEEAYRIKFSTKRIRSRVIAFWKEKVYMKKNIWKANDRNEHYQFHFHTHDNRDLHKMDTLFMENRYWLKLKRRSELALAVCEERLASIRSFEVVRSWSYEWFSLMSTIATYERTHISLFEPESMLHKAIIARQRNITRSDVCASLEMDRFESSYRQRLLTSIERAYDTMGLKDAKRTLAIRKAVEQSVEGHYKTKDGVDEQRSEAKRYDLDILYSLSAEYVLFRHELPRLNAGEFLRSCGKKASTGEDYNSNLIHKHRFKDEIITTTTTTTTTTTITSIEMDRSVRWDNIYLNGSIKINPDTVTKPDVTTTFEPEITTPDTETTSDGTTTFEPEITTPDTETTSYITETVEPEITTPDTETTSYITETVEPEITTPDTETTSYITETVEPEITTPDNLMTSDGTATFEPEITTPDTETTSYITETVEPEITTPDTETTSYMTATFEPEITTTDEITTSDNDNENDTSSLVTTPLPTTPKVTGVLSQNKSSTTAAPSTTDDSAPTSTTTTPTSPSVQPITDPEAPCMFPYVYASTMHMSCKKHMGLSTRRHPLHCGVHQYENGSFLMAACTRNTTSTTFKVSTLRNTLLYRYINIYIYIYIYIFVLLFLFGGVLSSHPGT